MSSFNKVGSSATSNASKVKKLASAINSLKSKTITVTTRYVTSGSPPRRAQFGMHETLMADTIIQAHAGERVDIGPGAGTGNVDVTHTVPVGSAGGGAGAGAGRGNREIVIPVTLMLDNKVLIRTVRRGLVEEVSGAM